MSPAFGSTRTRAVLLGGLMVIAAAIYFQFLFRKAAGSPAARRPGTWLLATPDTGGRVPGNPESSEKQMRDLYVDLRIFMKRHRRPPRNPAEFMRAIQGSFDYPFGWDDLLNPDCRFADSAPLRRGPRCFPYQLYSRRPDGRPIGSPKEAGARDVLAMTGLYYHRNSKGPSNWNPVGFFLVLWDDGEVTRVPFDKVLMYRHSAGSFKYAFPGQAGVPVTAIRFRQYFKRAPSSDPGEA